jgi:hypothetical protein
MGLENVQLCCFVFFFSHPSDWGSLTTCVLTSCDPIEKTPIHEKPKITKCVVYSRIMPKFPILKIILLAILKNTENLAW